MTADGKIDLRDLKYIDLSASDLKGTHSQREIFSPIAQTARTFWERRLFDQDEAYAFAGYLDRAKVKVDASAHYFVGYLNSKHGKATLRGMAKSIVGANINAKEMQSIPIMLADKESQREYARKLNAIRERQRALVEQAFLMGALFISLQHLAFSGKL